ncbi:MAG TPA: hypothetical protein VGJ00_02780 [Rhabdochlamydiaceae bacterium]
MSKELKSAQRPLAPDARLYSDELSPEQVLKKYPKRIAKTEKGMLQGLKKRLKAKESQKQKKHSKRTNCGEVDEHSPPAHVHVEGTRWVKNLRMQSKIERKRLGKQQLKRSK